MARIGFHGAAGTVTGSRFLVESGRRRVLVDCGLFQGPKELRARNWAPLPFAAKSVERVLLTHAHIDHSGYLPRLVRDGFRGPVHVTRPTAELAQLLLRDSAMIQEEDAAYANRKGFSKHRPALPLYTLADAERALERLEVHPFGEWAELGRGLRFRFVPAGHILGSASIRLDVEEDGRTTRLLFSGDVGRYDAPLVRDPAPAEPCDVLVIESTYGDRTHPAAPVEDQLAELLRRVVASEGTLLVPAFAVGRAQQLLVHLRAAMEREPRLALPIHLDSPMAVDSTAIYRRFPEESGLEELELRSGAQPVFGRDVYLHRTQEESIRLNSLAGPRVIISSSGMLTGGRVLHHLRRLLPGERNVLVLSGHQAEGTRGWLLQRGARSLRIHGQDVPVRASLAELSGLSGHADSDQLLRWVADLPAPRRTFVTHGEPAAARALAQRLTRERGFACEVPDLGDTAEV